MTATCTKSPDQGSPGFKPMAQACSTIRSSRTCVSTRSSPCRSHQLTSLHPTELQREWLQILQVTWRERKYWDGPAHGHSLVKWLVYGEATTRNRPKSLDDIGAVGYLLDVDIWQSGATKIMKDGLAVKGLCLNHWIQSDITFTPRVTWWISRKGCPSDQSKMNLANTDAFFWSRMCHGTPCSIEPDPTEKTLFVFSMMHANTVKPASNMLDVTCPQDVVDSDRHDEVVHREEIPGSLTLIRHWLSSSSLWASAHYLVKWSSSPSRSHRRSNLM